MEAEEKLMNADEVADLLQISPQTVRRLARCGELGCYRIGRKGRTRKGVLRFDRKQVEEFLKTKEG